MIAAIQQENLSGQKRKNANGEVVEIPDPKTTVAAALTLSKARAESVKSAIQKYAEENGFMVDMSQALPLGVGIASPVVPRPKDMKQAAKNMRVVFRVVRVKAEALNQSDFNFDKE